MPKTSWAKSQNYLNGSRECAIILSEVQKQVGALYAEKHGA